MMNHEEISLIQSKHNAAIVAPAGHGKTEMIVDLVEAFGRKVLLVTHTNAGIDALTKRLNKRGIARNKYSITTIAGFCIRWCSAYPHISETKDIPITSNDYYTRQYNGTKTIFQNEWARDVIKRTYDCVIIDEYQDCVISQHQIFLEINKTVPVIVLGDPLQAIFGWAGKLVSWNDLIFERITIDTYPWRWEKTNPALGKYLNDIRPTLEQGLTGKKVVMPIQSVEGCVQVVPTSYKNGMSLMNLIRNYKNTVYITKYKNDQELFSRNTGGIFQNDEAQNLNVLFEIADVFDKRDGLATANKLFDFLEMCATGIKTELASYKKYIQNGAFTFDRIRKFPEFGSLMTKVYQEPDNKSIINVIDWIAKEEAFRLYRKELYSEMRRALILSNEKSISILEAAQMIRIIPSYQRKQPEYKMLSSRTVLSKGLEFECVIVDLEHGMTVTDCYVALTRATKQIILISDLNSMTLDPPRL